MTKIYKRKEMIEKPSLQGVLIRICPECKNHKQGHPIDVLDCKNLYIWGKDKKGDNITGQCMCYSKEHGDRR